MVDEIGHDGQIHSKTPWVVVRYGDHFDIQKASKPSYTGPRLFSAAEVGESRAKANADYAVACVNAMSQIKGIKPEDVPNLIVTIRTELDEVKKHHAEALAHSAICDNERKEAENDGEMD